MLEFSQKDPSVQKISRLFFFLENGKKDLDFFMFNAK